MAVFPISKDNVCYGHTGIKSAEARQARLKNCERRNHELGFGTPPACGDGHHAKPPNPNTPQSLLIQINPWHYLILKTSTPTPTQQTKIPKIYERQSSQPLGPGGDNRYGAPPGAQCCLCAHVSLDGC
jgi:hypothetical protein